MTTLNENMEEKKFRVKFTDGSGRGSSTLELSHILETWGEELEEDTGNGYEDNIETLKEWLCTSFAGDELLMDGYKIENLNG
jgi:hypothetical protein